MHFVKKLRLLSAIAHGKRNLCANVDQSSREIPARPESQAPSPSVPWSPARKFPLVVCAVVMLVFLAGRAFYSRELEPKLDPHLTWRDFWTFDVQPDPIGVLEGDALARLGLKGTELRETESRPIIRYIGKTPYLDNTHAVVTHSLDDSTLYLSEALDLIDRYDIKATAFVSTEKGPIEQLWPRLQRAVTNGHEIGSHSRRHRCHPQGQPDSLWFAFQAYSGYEVTGSRFDILGHTSQPYVWSWAYPCGNCANYEFVKRKLAQAGYIVARNYPNEKQNGHLVPDLQSYATDPYDASYTQIVQDGGATHGVGRTSVSEINAKFDEVYRRRGIYHFMSHPQWLDYRPHGYYQQHLAHISRRSDVWYVPLGPLYAYHEVVQQTQVRWLDPQNTLGRVVVYNNLDPKIFDNSITLQFVTPESIRLVVLSGNKPIPERKGEVTDRWNREYFRRDGQMLYVTIRPNTILEFRTG